VLGDRGLRQGIVAKCLEELVIRIDSGCLHDLAPRESREVMGACQIGRLPGPSDSGKCDIVSLESA